MRTLPAWAKAAANPLKLSNTTAHVYVNTRGKTKQAWAIFLISLACLHVRPIGWGGGGIAGADGQTKRN